MNGIELKSFIYRNVYYIYSIFLSDNCFRRIEQKLPLAEWML